MYWLTNYVARARLIPAWEASDSETEGPRTWCWPCDCPVMLSVTLIRAFSLLGHCFHTWDNSTQYWSSCYRVRCEDLWNHFPRVLWDSPKKNTMEKNPLKYWQREKTFPGISSTQRTTVTNYNWKCWATVKWEAVTSSFLLYFTKALQMEPTFSSQEIIKDSASNSSWSKDQEHRVTGTAQRYRESFLVLIKVAGALTNVGVGSLMLVLFIMFLSEFFISSTVDNTRGLCQTLAGRALLVSSLDSKLRPAILPPLLPVSVAISERKPRGTPILAPQGRGPTQSFPNTWGLVIYVSIVKALGCLTILTLTQNALVHTRCLLLMSPQLTKYKAVKRGKSLGKYQPTRITDAREQFFCFKHCREWIKFARSHSQFVLQLEVSIWSLLSRKSNHSY